MLRFLTAGESHGECLTGILEGLPAGMQIDSEFINKQLERRQAGYGRGGRMQIEKDTAKIVSGLHKGRTIGSPIGIYIKNKDFSIEKLPEVKAPRPGHADLAGFQKYGMKDIRSVLERASARETAMRVAVGAIAKLLLKNFGIEIASHVVELGGVEIAEEGIKVQDIFVKAEQSPVRCVSKKAEEKMIEEIKKTEKEKDTLGGVFEVVAVGLVPGVGSYVQWDKRLDAAIAAAVMSIPGVKGVEIGLGFRMKGLPGSKVHDPLYHRKSVGIYRKTNRAGGIEGGMSNGEPITVRGLMKPIATLRKPLDSVDVDSKKKVQASVERSDTCVVPSAGVIGEAMTALEIANGFLAKFGGDSISDIKYAYKRYVKRIDHNG